MVLDVSTFLSTEVPNSEARIYLKTSFLGTGGKNFTLVKPRFSLPLPASFLHTTTDELGKYFFAALKIIVILICSIN